MAGDAPADRIAAGDALGNRSAADAALGERVVTVVARAGLVVIAVAAITALVFGLRTSRLESQATAAAGARIQPEEVPRVLSLLRDAEQDNRDTRPLLLQAQALAFSRRPAAAIAVLNRAVAREPDNVDAWRLLARAADGVDPERAAEAQRQIRALSPPVAP